MPWLFILRSEAFDRSCWMRQTILYLFCCCFFLGAVTLSGAQAPAGNGKLKADGFPGMCAKLPYAGDGITRLSMIEVYPQYRDEYRKFASEVGEISLRVEPGVLAMYAMEQKDDPCIISILEIYASQEAYRAHVASPHFLKYKEGTLHMVKSLRLLDQTPFNQASRIINYLEGE